MRFEAVLARIQSGLRTHADSRERSVQLADQLVAHHDTEGITIDLEQDQQIESVTRFVDTDTLQRLRKLTEIIEDDLSVNLGHSKFARLATTAADFSSIAHIAVAGYNLLVSADALDAAAAQANSVDQIKDRRFEDFYFSICVFAIEVFLFTTPFNYNIAWKGTRYLNNRYLYRIRGFSSNAYRFVLSEVHYTIRGIAATALRSVEELTEYLISTTVWTLELIRKHPDSSLKEIDLPARIEGILSEFYSFVDATYDFEVPNIDLGGLIAQIIAEADDILDISLLAVDATSADVTSQ